MMHCFCIIGKIFLEICSGSVVVMRKPSQEGILLYDVHDLCKDFTLFFCFSQVLTISKMYH